MSHFRKYFFSAISGIPLIDILIFYSIIIDFINGALQEFEGIHSSIGIIFRGGILLYLMRENQIWQVNPLSRLFKFCLGVYIISIPIWSLTVTEFSLVSELGTLIRFIYFWAVIFYFQLKASSLSSVLLARVVFITLALFSLVNIWAFWFDFGVKSYSKEIGFGVKAFYADGNSASIYAVTSLLISAWYVLKCRKVWYFIIFILSTIGTILIGTRMAIFGSILTWTIFPSYILLFSDKRIILSTVTKGLLFLILLIIGMYSGSLAKQALDRMDQFNRERYKLENLVTPRARLITHGTRVINSYEKINAFIGKGRSGGSISLGQELIKKEGEAKIIEADFYDQILFYGYLFGTMMCILYICLFWVLVRGWFHNRSYQTFIAMMVGITWLVASHMGGHGFSNVLLAPILGTALVYSKKG